jgi:curli biogenesis system outer membrane secretion channel CsgG
MPRVFLILAAALATASCAGCGNTAPVVVAVTGIEAKDPGEAEILAKATEERLKEVLCQSRRFKLVERKRLAEVLEEQKGDQVGRLVGADWVIYGLLESWGIRGSDPELEATAKVRLTVVRVVDGQILFSKAATAIATGMRPDEALLHRAVLDSTDKLLAEIDRLPR